MPLLYHAQRGANQTLILNIPMIMNMWIIRVVGMINNRRNAEC